MRHILRGFVVGALFCGGDVSAQERPIPKDSTRVTMPGCVRGTTFIAAGPREAEPVRSDVKEGSRFRLVASKSTMKDLAKRKGSMVEITGLVRNSHMQPGGVSVFGGRVRIGGAMPRDPASSDVTRDARYSEIVLDVESWQLLPGSCPLK